MSNLTHLNTLAKRIIPCLDIQNGRTVKGVRFQNLRDAGDPVELATIYSESGADELVFLDISASNETRKTQLGWVEAVASAIQIPFTVGGGIAHIRDVEALLKSGADKVTVNSAAITNPVLINELADKFGSQCIVLAVDAGFKDGRWQVFSHGGSKPTALDLFEWAEKAVARGAGEILFTSLDHDGTRHGFALQALKTLSDSVPVPIIASGGAGNQGHFLELFLAEAADAALAAGIFHYGELTIPDLKRFLSTHHIPVRI